MWSVPFAKAIRFCTSHVFLLFAGSLVNVVIPRPQPNGEPSPGLGKVGFGVCAAVSFHV